MSAKPEPADDRRRELSLIHVAKAQLGMDDETYRAMLWTVGRAKSSADLDHAGRRRVLDHLKACGFTPKAKPGARNRHIAERPRNFHAPDRQAQWRKVEALLTAERRPWAYATAMAKRMFSVDALEFLHTEQLQRLIAALEIDKKRRAGRKEH